MYFSPLLLAYDGSAASDHALGYVVENLRDTAAEVVVINVQPPLIHEPELMDLGPALARADREEGERILAPARAILRDAGIRHTAEVVFGEPAEAVARAAQVRGSRLIVAGASHRRPMGRFLRASMVSRLLALSPVPVTVVREPVSIADRTRRLAIPAFLSS